MKAILLLTAIIAVSSAMTEASAKFVKGVNVLVIENIQYFYLRLTEVLDQIGKYL